MSDSKTVTLCDLEQAIARLKLAPFFSFDQKPLNEDWGQWDVFPDVEDLEDFEPTDHGNASAVLMWSRDASDVAFDDDGILQHALPMVWAGSQASVQMAFAEGGLTVTIERDEEAREGYGESGKVILSPQSRSLDCDLLHVLRAFEKLNDEGVIALANAGYTASDGWSDVSGYDEDGGGTAAFWTEQKHDAFDDVGNLNATLFLHWKGNGAAIVESLRRSGLAVNDVPEESSCIKVTGAKSPSVQLPSFDEASEAVIAAISTRPIVPKKPAKRVESAHAGPLELAGAFRGPDRQPVDRLAFDPHRPTRLAMAQELDAHGFPSSPGYVVDLDKNAVERALLAGTQAMGVGGMRFLRDGRLLFATTQLRKLGPGDTHQDKWGTNCVVFHVWDPEKDAEEEVFSQGFSHTSTTSLLTCDEGERFMVLGQPNGAEVRAIPARGASWPEPQTLKAFGGDTKRAYTRTVISPDGVRVAWCDDWSQPLVCFDRASGEVLFAHPPANESKRQIRFSRDSSAIAMLVGRDARSVRFVSAESGDVIHASLTTATEGAQCFALHPSGLVVAVGRQDGIVRVHAIPDGKLLAEAELLANGYVSALEFDGTGKHLLLGGSKGDIALFRYTEQPDVSVAAAVAAPVRDAATPILAGRKKGHPLVGARGRMMVSKATEPEVTITAISPDGLRVQYQVGEKLDSWSKDWFWKTSDAGHVSPGSPYQVGDRVLVHLGLDAVGREFTVEDVDESQRRVLVYDEDGRVRFHPFNDILLCSPVRRDPLPEFVAALERTRHRGRQVKLREWCAEQLEAVAWDLKHEGLRAGRPLAAEYAALENAEWEAAAAAHAERLADLQSTFVSLSWEERTALWRVDFKSWLGEVAYEVVEDGGKKFWAVTKLRRQFGHKKWDHDETILVG